MRIIYHNADLDGKCSAAIVAHWAGRGDRSMFVGLDYGDPVDIDTLCMKGEEVYMVDFSLPPDQMVALNARAILHWIDHHSPRIREMAESPLGCPAPDGGEGSPNFGFHFSGGYALAPDKPAACLLTWEYMWDRAAAAQLPGRLPSQSRTPPLAVRLLNAYDTWDKEGEFDWDREVLAFQYGMRSFRCEPWSSCWGAILGPDRGSADATAMRIQGEGGAILRYRRQSDRILAAGAAFRTHLRGHSAIAVNRLYANSEVFNTIDKSGAALLISFGFDGRPGWRVSLSPGPAAPDLNCGELARELGGGGHPGRAGFCCGSLPFSLPVPDTQEVRT